MHDTSDSAGLAFERLAAALAQGVDVSIPDRAATLRHQEILPVLDSISEGFVILDRDWKFVFANSAAERFIQKSRDELIGQGHWDLFPEASDRRFGLEYRRAVAENVPVHFEEFYPEPLNKWYEVRAYPWAEGLSIFFRDVTERKQLEEALRVNLAKYSVLFDSFPLGISVTDSEGRLLEANRAAERLLGLSAEEHSSRRIDGAEWRIIRPDGSPMPADEFASVRALEEKRLVEDVEMGMVRSGEEPTWISVSAAPLPLAGYGVVITYGDVSSRRRAETRLEEARGEAVAARLRLEAIMDSLPTGVAIIDAQGGIVRANAAYDRIWGAGRPAAQSVADYTAFKAWWIDSGREVQPEEWASARAVRLGETVTGQVMEIARFDGGRAYVLNAAAPLFDANGEPAGCAVAIHDITRRVEAEQALARSEAALQRANDELQKANTALRRSKETLEARVSARTVDLARRTAQLEALAQDLTRAEERERQRVAQVIHDHLQQMLSVARINLGMALGQIKTKSIQKGLSEVDGLLAEALDITRSLTADLSPAILHRSGLAAALRWLGRWYQDRFALTVLVDAEEGADLDEEVRVTLFRSVRELLFNVVKHAKVTSARVRLSQSDGSRVRIVVSDDGVGFDPEAVRAREGTAGSFGLFSLRERLESLGGQFEVDSAPGCGASFTIIAPPPQRAAPEPLEPDAAPGAPPAVPARTRAAARKKPARAKKR